VREVQDDPLQVVGILVHETLSKKASGTLAEHQAGKRHRCIGAGRAAPRPRAIAIERGPSSGSRRLISLWDTIAWTTAESAKPRIGGHRIPNHGERHSESVR